MLFCRSCCFDEIISIRSGPVEDGKENKNEERRKKARNMKQLDSRDQNISFDEDRPLYEMSI